MLLYAYYQIIKRLSNVYELSEEDALKVVASMSNNEEYIEKSNRIFCTQWSKDITDKQVINNF